MDAITQTAHKLADASLKRMNDAFLRVNYEDTLDETLWQMPEEYISIYFEPEYQALDVKAKMKLSLLEMINYFSVNIHGEQSLIAEFEKRLYRGKSECENFDCSRYMQHFIHEENSHTFMLAEYCHRYYGSVMKVKTMAIDREPLSFEAEELLLYARTQLLENFLVFMNRQVATNEACGTTARQCNKVHMQDEVRHIAWDRAAMAYYKKRLITLDRASEVQNVIAAVLDYQETAFRLLYNPKIYKEIGIANPIEVASRARTNPLRIEALKSWRAATDKTIDELRQH